MKKMMIAALALSSLTLAHAEVSEQDFNQLKQKVDRLEKMIVVDRSVDSFLSYLEEKDLRLQINSNISLERQQELFAVVRNCFDDVIASHPNKKFKFPKVRLTNTSDYVDVDYKEFTIGQRTSVFKCRTEIVTEGLVKK